MFHWHVLCVQSADDFSERSLRMAEVNRDQSNLAEEEEESNRGEERGTGHKSLFVLWDVLNTIVLFTVNGNAEQVDFIDSSVTEEEDDIRTNTSTPPSVAVILTPICSCHAVSCPVFVLIMLTAYWFFRIRRTDRHCCNPRSQQHPGQWCEAQSEFCMAVSPAVGSNLRAQGLLCNTTSRNLNSKLKEEYWLSAQISPPKV